MHRTQWTWTKSLTFFKFTTHSIATYQMFTPCTCKHELHKLTTPKHLLQLSTGKSSTLSLQNHLFFPVFFWKLIAFLQHGSSGGGWFMELKEKMSWVLKDFGLLPQCCKTQHILSRSFTLHDVYLKCAKDKECSKKTNCGWTTSEELFFLLLSLQSDIHLFSSPLWNTETCRKWMEQVSPAKKGRWMWRFSGWFMRFAARHEKWCSRWGWGGL